MEIKNRFWLKWIINYSLGELLVIGVATTVGRLLLVEASDFISHSPVYVAPLLLITVGVVEGWTIGYLQWRSLNRLLVNFRPRPWILVTIAATGVGWVSVVPPTIFLVAFFVDFGLINKYYSLLYSGLAGMAFGGFIGIVQYFVLRKFYKNAMAWMLSNILVWMFSFSIIYMSVSMLNDRHTILYNVAVMILACIFSGLVQGLIMGTCVHFLMVARKGNGQKV